MFLCEKRQEILGLFSLERDGLAVAARGLSSLNAATFSIPHPWERKGMLRGRVATGTALPQRNTRGWKNPMESCSGRNPIPLGREEVSWE